MSQLRNQKTSGKTRYSDYLLRVDESADKVTEICERVEEAQNPEGQWVETKRRLRRSSQQKYHAVNGPMAGQRLLPAQADQLGYTRYNRSSEWRRNGTHYTKEPFPKAVWVIVE